MRESACAVYIMTNDRRTVLYTGVTADLLTRVQEHKTRRDTKSFTARYNTVRLVYFELTPNIAAAIAREKQIKAGPRSRKLALIESMNPEWHDLSADW